ncbi:MAG: hypothetical protein NC833_05680 [Candidatus Omnitrophica bacterium]|nr:hypothetical protein [Candidatus Omnitrophota bacterium]
MDIREKFESVIGEIERGLEKNIHRRLDIAYQYIMKGEKRPYPVLSLNRGPDPFEKEILGKERVKEETPEERVLEKLKGLIEPLKLLNPIRPQINLGRGVGSLVASFGIQLIPESGYYPKGYKNIDQLIYEGVPDVERSGLIPEMKEEIDIILSYTPNWIKIGLPDMQGPFNIACMSFGDEIFTLPFTNEKKFHKLMEITTDFFISLHKKLLEWIPKDRISIFPSDIHRIAECSVNMISEKMYKEFVLPYDKKIVDYFGEVAIHPCSGPHVFYATIRNLPNVVYTEAGYIEKTFAGYISVDDALKEIGERKIILNIGQELPEGEEEKFIKRDLERAKGNQKLIFGYTGMHWRKKDEDYIKELHLKLDDYWSKYIF